MCAHMYFYYFFYVVDILLVEDRLGWKACPRYIEKNPWWEASQMDK